MLNFIKFASVTRFFSNLRASAPSEGTEAIIKQLVATSLDNKYYIGRIEELEHERVSLEARISELKDEKDALRTELLSALRSIQGQPFGQER